MTDSTFKKVIAEIAGSFVEGKRDNGESFYKVKDDAPEWMRGFGFMRHVSSAVDDRMPDDWIYEHTMRIAESMTGYDFESADDIREYSHEIVDGMVDVYTSDLYKWLASHIANGSLCDEALEERGVPESATMEQRIGAGQFLGLERIFYAIVDGAEQEANLRDDNAADEQNEDDE